MTYRTSPVRYEFLVRGRLSRRYEVVFEGVTVEPRPGETALRADVSDQTQLDGLLNRLQDVGIDLISVNAIAEAGDAL